MDDRLIKRAILGGSILLAAALGIYLFWHATKSTPARADGCNPQLQDCSFKGEPFAAPRRAPISYTYSVTPEIIRKRGGSKCGKNIPVWECEMVFSKVRAEDARRAKMLREGRRLPAREARDSYRDERGRKVIVIDDGERRRDRNDDRDCRRRITVTSKPRLTKALACGEARKLWSMRALDEHGGEFARISSAKGVSSDPHPFHEGAWRDVCTFSAVPCRDNRRDD